MTASAKACPNDGTLVTCVGEDGADELIGRCCTCNTTIVMYAPHVAAVKQHPEVVAPAVIADVPTPKEIVNGPTVDLLGGENGA